MQQYQPLLDKVLYTQCIMICSYLLLQRREILSGEYEPTDEECQWMDDTEVKGQ